MRVALCARVSTHDQQTLGLQSEAMRSYIRGRGWDAVKQVYLPLVVGFRVVKGFLWIHLSSKQSIFGGDVAPTRAPGRR